MDPNDGVYHLRGRQGTTWIIDLQCRDSAGDPLDISSASEIRYSIGTIGAEKLLASKTTGSIVVTEGLTGKCRVTITPTMQTAAGLLPGIYEHQGDVQLAADQVFDQVSGTFRVTPSLFD